MIIHQMIDGNAWIDDGDNNLVVIRGSSFDYYDRNCRSDFRSETPKNYPYHGTVFRVVCS